VKAKAAIEKWCVVNTWHGSVVLERGAIIGIGSIVLGPVTMGTNCRCSQNCFITGQSHRYDDVSKNLIEQGFDIREVVIEENVWIGSNSVILPGVTIGKNSVIGAGAVVTKDIPPFSLAVGNPARVVKQYVSETGRWERV
jgi:acetyltransferase-like isoleucine patch superfamily enzyme